MGEGGGTGPQEGGKPAAKKNVTKKRAGHETVELLGYDKATMAKIGGAENFSPLALILGEILSADQATDSGDGATVKEVFIPLSPNDLTDEIVRLMPDWFPTPESRQTFAEVARFIESRCRIQINFHLQQWMEGYNDFDPDFELAGTPGMEHHQDSSDNNYDFRNQLLRLLERAGFMGVGPVCLERAFDAKDEDGVNVVPENPDKYACDLFYRGLGEQVEQVPTMSDKLKFWSKGKSGERRGRLFKRLVVVTRSKHYEKASGKGLWRWLQSFGGETMDAPLPLLEGKWYLKMFKDLAESDLDLVLPGGRVAFTVLDYLMIIAPLLVSAASSVWKIMNGGILFDSPSEIMSSLVLVFFPFILFAKAMSAVFEKREEYHGHLATELLRASMGQNSTVLALLIREAVEQDTLEALLAYSFIWNGGRGGLIDSRSTLDREVEGFMKTLTDPMGLLPRNFQSHDALNRLKTLQILKMDTTPDGVERFLVPPLDQCLKNLSRGLHLRKEVHAKALASTDSVPASQAWKEVVKKNESGNLLRFWHNTVTGASSWFPPGASPAPAPVMA